MLNGAAVSFTSKMQTLTAPSTTWAETKTLFDCSTDVLGLRNLLSELGHLQEGPTIIYQDNKSAIQIATNRGSLGKTSRAMDLQTLSIRDRIEDHLVFPEYLETDRMIADMGSKALPETPFIKFRDVMNGYALVRARFPDLPLSKYVYDISTDPDFNCDFHHSRSRLSSLIMSMKYHSYSMKNDEINGDHNDDEIEEEEEEDGDNDEDNDEDNSTIEEETNAENLNQSSDNAANPYHGVDAQSDDHQLSDEDIAIPIPCQAFKETGFCRWGSGCRFQHINPYNQTTTTIISHRSFDTNHALSQYTTYNYDITPQARLGGLSPYELRNRSSLHHNINHSTNPCPTYSELHHLITSESVRREGMVNNGGVASLFSFNMNHYPGVLWENDDLPDPRLYNIDVQKLRHWQIRDQDDAEKKDRKLSQMVYNSYDRYLQEIEPVLYNARLRESTRKFTITTVNQHLPTPASIQRRMFSPIMFFPPMLSNNKTMRSFQIQRSLNTFIVRLEALIDNKVIDEVTDNIYWGIFTPNPTPQKAWLRWLRWRTYHNHLTFSNLRNNTITTELEQPEYGPPFLRPIDRRRMELHNCFSLDTITAQYYHLGGCCDEEGIFPKVRHCDPDKVVLYTCASIWRIGHDDEVDSTYIMHKPEILRCNNTWGQQRLKNYLEHLNPEWGRWAILDQPANKRLRGEW
jgi:hypothetical protein